MGAWSKVVPRILLKGVMANPYFLIRRNGLLLSLFMKIKQLAVV